MSGGHPSFPGQPWPMWRGSEGGGDSHCPTRPRGLPRSPHAVPASRREKLRRLSSRPVSKSILPRAPRVLRFHRSAVMKGGFVAHLARAGLDVSVARGETILERFASLWHYRAVVLPARCLPRLRGVDWQPRITAIWCFLLWRGRRGTMRICYLGACLRS